MLSVETRPAEVRRVWPRALVDLAIVCLGGLIVGIILRGGGQVDVLGIRVSFTRLYTPVLMLTLMIGVRVWMAVSVRSKVANACAAAGARADGCGRGARVRRDSVAAAVGHGIELRPARLD